MIDVLWLYEYTIVAAFEVEHTSTVYSGLLRMADLITMQPWTKTNLYIVAPDDRRERVIAEVNRPTFAKLKQPLPKICKFIPYSQLTKAIEKIRDMGPGLRPQFPEFVDGFAISCELPKV